MHYEPHELDIFLKEHGDANALWNTPHKTPFWPLLFDYSDMKMQLPWLNPVGIRILLSYPQGVQWFQGIVAHEQYAPYLYLTKTLSTIIECMGSKDASKLLEPIKKTLLISDRICARPAKEQWSDPYILQFHAASKSVKTFIKSFDTIMKALAKDGNTETPISTSNYGIDNVKEPSIVELFNAANHPKFTNAYPLHAQAIEAKIVDFVQTDDWIKLYKDGALNDWRVPDTLKPLITQRLGGNNSLWNVCQTMADYRLREFAMRNYQPVDIYEIDAISVLLKNDHSEYAKQYALDLVKNHLDGEYPLVAQIQAYRCVQKSHTYSDKQRDELRQALTHPYMRDDLDGQVWDGEVNTMRFLLPWKESADAVALLGWDFWDRRLNHIVTMLMDDHTTEPWNAGTALKNVHKQYTVFSETWSVLKNTPIAQNIDMDSPMTLPEMVLRTLIERSNMHTPYEVWLEHLQHYVQTCNSLDIKPNAMDFSTQHQMSHIEMEGLDHVGQ